MLPLVGGANRLCCILNEFDVPLLTKSCNLLDTNSMTESVHRYASLDATTGVLVVASELVLTESEVL